VRVHTVKPWRLYYRPATYAHRVLLHSVYDVTAEALTVTKKQAVTLVLMTKRRREWGFFTRNGWQQWLAYFTERGC
jgi:hypothetical protein